MQLNCSVVSAMRELSNLKAGYPWILPSSDAVVKVKNGGLLVLDYCKIKAIITASK